MVYNAKMKQSGYHHLSAFFKIADFVKKSIYCVVLHCNHEGHEEKE